MTTVILKGDIPTNTGVRHRDQVSADVGVMESGNTHQVRKEGVFALTYRKAMVENEREVLEEVDRVAGEALVEKETFIFSPLLGKMTIADFPDGFTFGNHSGGPHEIMMDGSPVMVCWVVFPKGTVLTADQVYRLQEIYEGIPPGTPS